MISLSIAASQIFFQNERLFKIFPAITTRRRNQFLKCPRGSAVLGWAFTAMLPTVLSSAALVFSKSCDDYGERYLPTVRFVKGYLFWRLGTVRFTRTQHVYKGLFYRSGDHSPTTF